MNPIVSYVLIALLAYLLGTSNLAYFIARRRGIDLFHKGSNNPGASNAMMLMGWKTGILVGLHDIGKAFLAAFLSSIRASGMDCSHIRFGKDVVNGKADGLLFEKDLFSFFSFNGFIVDLS